jgi:hypothetical protein
LWVGIDGIDGDETSGVPGNQEAIAWRRGDLVGPDFSWFGFFTPYANIHADISDAGTDLML